MARVVRIMAILLVPLVASMIGCGGSSSSPCGPPAPVAPPPVVLEYPTSGATGVSSSVGLLIVAGVSSPNSYNPGPPVIGLRTSSDTTVNIGTPTVAASPLPTPIAAPTGLTLFQVSLPQLSSQTAYTVTSTYTNFTSGPVCTTPQTTSVGSFTTQ